MFTEIKQRGLKSIRCSLISLKQILFLIFTSILQSLRTWMNKKA